MLRDLCSPEAVTDLDEKTADREGAEGEAPAEDVSSFTRAEGESAADYARRIFDRVFRHDIENVLSMEVRRFFPGGSNSHPRPSI